jgi:hypothetical protein
VLSRPSTGHDGIWNEQFYVSVIYPLKKRKKVVKKSRENFTGKRQILLKLYRNNKMLEDILQALHPETYFVYPSLILLYQ